jgi:CHC2 zinc finger
LIRSDSVRRISPEGIEAVRDASRIEEISGERTRLCRSGFQLIGRCPLHDDKTPSFAVHPQKQVYCCHGCGAGGDVFDLVERLYDCSFVRAVEILADRAGITFIGFRPSQELSAKVAELRTQRLEETEFQRFCDERIRVVNEHCRNLGRSATHADRYLQTGDSDSRLGDLAWAALERCTSFSNRIEREGLVDAKVLREEWLARRGNHHAGA